MDICNATIQEKCAQSSQKRRAKYQAKKDTINKKRQETCYKKFDGAPSSTSPTCPSPYHVQECNIELQNSTQLNQLEKTKFLHFSENYYKARDNFRKKLDNLSKISTCLVCIERYPRIQMKKSNGSTTCYRCTLEKNGN